MNVRLPESESDLLTRISARLREGNPQQAQDLAAETLRSPEELRQWLPRFAREFRRRKYLEPIIDLLWANRGTALTEMFVLGCFMWICGRADLYDRFGPLLRSWVASDSTDDFTFSEKGTVRHFRKLTEEQKRDFLDAKYRRWKNVGVLKFLASVDRFSTSATVSTPITEFLFQNRADKGVQRHQWLRAFQSSEMLKHILADSRTINVLSKADRLLDSSRYPRLPDLDRLMDLDRSKSLFGDLDLSKGLLLCTIHDAHLILAKRCLLHCMPERHAIGLRGKGENKITVGKEGNAHLSAFQAVKVLRAKKTLFMVPDARRAVKQTTEATILGIPIPFADGAPTIAFESGCATSWYTLAREADSFVPVLVPGPSRETKESFASFKERWWTFYAARVEALFTGDPRNITLWHFWPKLFYSAAVPGSPDADPYLEEDVDEV